MDLLSMSTKKRNFCNYDLCIFFLRCISLDPIRNKSCAT